jgi:hypothetical protein
MALRVSARAGAGVMTEEVAEELAALVEVDVRREVGEGRVLASQEPGSVLPLVLSHVLIAALGGGRSAALDYVRSCAGPSGDVKQFERALRDALVPGKSIKVHRKLLDKVRSTLKSAARQASAASLATALRERVCELDRVMDQLESGTGERLSCSDVEALAHALEGLARRLRFLGGLGGGSPASADGTEPGSPSSGGSGGGSGGGSSGWDSFEPHGYGGQGPFGGGSGSSGGPGGIDEDDPFDGDFGMDFARLQARQLAFDEAHARRAAGGRVRQAPVAPERVRSGSGMPAEPLDTGGAAAAAETAAPPPLPPRKVKAKALTPILAVSAAVTVGAASRAPPSPAAIAAGAAAELDSEPDSDDEVDAQTEEDDYDAAEGDAGSPDGSSVDGAGIADVDSLATTLSVSKLESTSKCGAAASSPRAAAAASSPRAAASSPSPHAPAAAKKRWSVKGSLSASGASGTAH